MGCPAAISNVAHVVEATVPRELYDRFLEHRVRKQWAKGRDDVVECTQCHFMIITEEKLNVKCRREGCPNASGFCGLCGEPPHPGKSCEENGRELREAAERAKVAPTREELKAMGIVPCPTCGIRPAL